MDDCVAKDLSKSMKMGASGNADSAKFATLQERKKQIQEKLDKHHKELRKLCVDEAELTGQLPTEYPFEQGELPPTFRRRMGTAYALNKNLLNNLNNEEEIPVLEMEMHMLANMAQAALGLANEGAANKAARKAHLHEYEVHMAKYKVLENKLHDLKISPQQPPKMQHKKKPRPEREQQDTVSMTEPFATTPAFRHSLRSLQYQSSAHGMYAPPQQQQPVLQVKPRPASQRYVYHVPEGVDVPQQQQQAYAQHPAAVTPPVKVEPTFYKLSLDGYKQYEDKQESLDVAVSEGHFRSYTAQGSSRTLPHASRRSPQTHGYAAYTHTMRASHNHSPGAVNTLSVSSTSSSSLKYYPQAQHSAHARQYYETRVPHIQPTNPLQLQPHQQYEHVMPSGGGGGSATLSTSSGGSGLGGYWKQSENGEFWCNNAAAGESARDKRFGSLDRRKKRLQKKTALPMAMSLDVKGGILPVPSYEEATRTLPTKSQAIAARRHENRQLVRTQSLGSVGGMLDGSCQSDDSSCGSETINSELLRKNKQKEWYETSLDGPPPPQPVTPTPSLPPMRVRTHSHSHSIAASIAPEDKYDYSSSPTPTIQSHHAPHPPLYQSAQHSPKAPPPMGRVHSPQLPPQLHSPSTLKEIPAESNPSPRVLHQHENREIFNNNMPKNCTVVQQAQWKPYHEETKPFEMSDFYKYSTKYKKKADEVVTSAPSPSSSSTGSSNRQSVGSTGGFRNLPNMTSNRPADINVNTLVCNTSVSSNLSTSFDSNPLSPHVADNFSAEMMNAWYQKHEQSDNNNATLV